MTNNFRKIPIALLIAMTFALTLSAVALSLQPAALLQVRPPGYPTPVPTPAPTFGPTRNPGATYNPGATQTPGRPDQPPTISQWGKYQYHPWDAKVAPYTQPVVPKATLIPQLPPQAFRRPPPFRSAETDPGLVDKMLQVNPTVMPTYAPTPMPPQTYVPVQGYALPMNPRSTPTPEPSGGATFSHGLGLPYHPAGTPTPAPSGGYVPVQGYELPIHPVHPPTPAPTPIIATGPYRPATQDVPFVGLHPKKPVISVIPRNPAARFRTGSGEHA